MSSDPSGALAAKTLIVGCGYCGLELGRRLSAQGVPVWGTTRDPSERAEAFEGAGVEPIAWHLGGPAPVWPEALGEGTVDVVFSVPAIAVDGEVLAPIEAALEALGELSVRAFVYLGSTSVYGNSQGGVVKAETPPAPISERGRRRLASEDFILDWAKARGWRATVLRMPGIYGPGRTILPRLASGGFTLVDGGQKWGSRIHRDDVAMAAEVLLRQGEAGRRYLLTDGSPFRVREMVEWACARFGLPMPPEMPIEDYAKVKPRAASFWRTSNRYDNAAIAALPGFELKYPSFREGFEAVASEALSV